MAEFVMPSLGADMEDAILVAWLVKPGDQVERGQVIAEVETQKGVIEIEAFETGVLAEIRVQPGAKVPVGAVLATIGAEGAPTIPAAPAPPAPAAAPPAEPSPTVAAATAPGPAAVPAHIRVSPVARKLAEELGVDLSTVTGTGPGGAIQRADVEHAAEAARATPAAPPTPPAPAPPPPPAPAEPAVPPAATPPAARTPATQAEQQRLAMRDAIARAMARSKREIPHYYLGLEIDFLRAQEWLAAENLKRPVAERIVYATLLLKAAALAAREVPEVNGFWVDGAFRPSEAVHVGVAISLRQGGLVAPAIHHTDLLSLDELMRALRDLVMRARTGKLRGSEMTDPTITLTNLGEQGVSSVNGIIYPPQVALVGFGAVVERPWAVSGLLGIRPIVTATLAADHRASDGHRGGLYLSAVNRLLQDPEKLR
ncbi:MAG: dihydrolipoamide acetyltransferase family protein [Chloroflexota bacterium]